jgi:transposase-like protein
MRFGADDEFMSTSGFHRRRSVAEKRRIVESTMESGASVARVAHAEGVIANQVFGWPRLYRAGKLSRTPSWKHAQES